jgi:hypothetical protein
MFVNVRPFHLCFQAFDAALHAHVIGVCVAQFLSMLQLYANLRAQLERYAKGVSSMSVLLHGLLRSVLF